MASSSSGYRPDIDGLRAVAVVPVLLFHAQLACPGGYAGVDVFFVISGFLISSLLMREIATGSFSLVAFWERRVRRILPALVVMMLSVLVAGWFLFLPQDYKTVGESAVAQTLLLSNAFFWQLTGYFSPSSDTKPLLHTWSLAVEEQFYVFFPLLLVFVLRNPRRSLTTTLATFGIASFLLSVLGSYVCPSATFYFLPTRAWELLLGAWLAARSRQAPSRIRFFGPIAFVGVGFVTYSFCFYDSSTRFPGIAALLPCIGAACILASSQLPASFVGKVLATKPLAFIGRVSYPLYLWHWPLLTFLRYPLRTSEWQSPVLRGGALAVSFVLAVLTWKYIETPIRRRTCWRSGGQLAGFATASTLGILTFGMLTYLSQGFPSRYPVGSLRNAATWHRTPFTRAVGLAQAKAGDFSPLGSIDSNRRISVLVWGDSHAMAVAPTLDELCRTWSKRGVLAAHSATAPVLEYASRGEFALQEDSAAVNDQILSFVSRNKIQSVLLVAHWNGYAHLDTLKLALIKTVRALIRTGARAYILREVPIQDFNVPRLAGLEAMRRRDPSLLGLTADALATQRSALDQTFQEIARMGGIVLDPAPYFLNDKGVYAGVRDGDLLYRDHEHLTLEGAKLLSPLFERVVRAE